MSVLTSLLALALVGLAWLWTRRRQPAGRTILRAGLMLTAVAAAAAVAGSVLIGGLTLYPSAPGSTPTGDRAEDPVDRMFGQSDQSDLNAIINAPGGRLATYAAAYRILAANQPFGAGLGQLVPTPYAYSDARANELGLQPGVDNAYLTFGVKAGVAGIAAVAALLLLPLLQVVRAGPRRMVDWFAPGWIGVLVLSVTQAFASSGYGPYLLALLVAVPLLRSSAVTRRPRPVPHRAPGRAAIGLRS